MLTWTFSAKEIICQDKSGNQAIILRRGEDGGIIFYDNGEQFFVDPADIDHFYFKEPKFFKSGDVAFFDEDGDVLTYVLDGRKIPLMIEVSRKEKDNFYLLFSALKQNGFEFVVA